MGWRGRRGGGVGQDVGGARGGTAGGGGGEVEKAEGGGGGGQDLSGVRGEGWGRGVASAPVSVHWIGQELLVSLLSYSSAFERRSKLKCNVPHSV